MALFKKYQFGDLLDEIYGLGPRSEQKMSPLIKRVASVFEGDRFNSLQICRSLSENGCKCAIYAYLLYMISIDAIPVPEDFDGFYISTKLDICGIMQKIENSEGVYHDRELLTIRAMEQYSQSLGFTICFLVIYHKDDGSAQLPSFYINSDVQKYRFTLLKSGDEFMVLTTGK